MKDTKKIFASTNLPVIIAKAAGDVKVRRFKCKETGQTVVANYMAKPYSPLSGGKLVPDSDKLHTLTAAEIDALEPLGTCPSCKAQLAAHKTLANALVGEKLYCIVCGEELEVKEIDEQAPADEVEAETPAEYLQKVGENFKNADAINKDNSGMPPVEAEAETEEEHRVETLQDPDAVSKDEAEGLGGEAVPSTGADTAPAEYLKDLGKAADKVGENFIEAEADEGNENADRASDNSEPAESADEGEPAVTAESTDADDQPAESADEPAAEAQDEEIRIDMLSRVQAGINTKKIELVASAHNFHYVMVAAKPVATLHKDRASAEIKEIFSNVGFLESTLAAAIEKEGLTKSVISTFGLVPMMIKIKASEAIQKAIDDKQEEMMTQMEAEKAELDEGYQQALGMAAVGVNRNLFDGTRNVLAEDLIEDLEQTGLEDAREIVEAAFARSGEDYLRTILAKAQDFKGKSAEVRNELANTILASTFKKTGLNLTHKATASVKGTERADNNYEQDVSALRNKLFRK